MMHRSSCESTHSAGLCGDTLLLVELLGFGNTSTNVPLDSSRECWLCGTCGSNLSTNGVIDRMPPREELGRYTLLLIEVNRLLEDAVGERVALRQVLGND
jgi:hypothetical protein